MKSLSSTIVCQFHHLILDLDQNKQSSKFTLETVLRSIPTLQTSAIKIIILKIFNSFFMFNHKSKYSFNFIISVQPTVFLLSIENIYFNFFSFSLCSRSPYSRICIIKIILQLKRKFSFTSSSSSCASYKRYQKKEKKKSNEKRK